MSSAVCEVAGCTVVDTCVQLKVKFEFYVLAYSDHISVLAPSVLGVSEHTYVPEIHACMGHNSL